MKKSILFATIATILILNTAYAANKNGGTNAAAVTMCANNKYRAANGQCTNCPQDCMRCHLPAQGAVKCDACTRGKYVAANGACAALAAGCEVGKGARFEQCERWAPGKKVIIDPRSKQPRVVSCDGNRNVGGTGIAHCMKCAIDEAATDGRSKCLECAPGKYLKSTTTGQNTVITCHACTTANCAFCPGDVCKRCATTHWAVKDGNGVITCPNACSAAQGLNCGAQGKCDANRGCFSCGADTSMVSAGVAAFPNRKKCHACSSHHAKCSICTATKCLGCKDGFALSKDGSTCAKIGGDAVDVNNCQVAQIFTVGQNDVYKCTACNPKFYADNTGTCQPCAAGCFFCKEAGKCEICAPGTFWKTDKCTRCTVANCRICASETKCTVCKPGMYADAKDGSCKKCHDSCGECVDGTKTGCLTCRNSMVFTTVQKKMGVEYEDAKKLADRLDKPPTGSDLMKINFQMVRAMKTKPASRILAKVKPSADEEASIKAMETLGATESDKKSTDMTDDKAMNEIWNSDGALELSDDDAASRKKAEGKQKKVRKMVGFCQKTCPQNMEGMGFFHDKVSNFCYKCKSDCQKCGMFEGECSTCGWGMYEVESATATEVEDDDGNVQEIKSKTCAKCHPSCKRCSGPAVNQCKGCAKGFQLRNGTCVSGGRCLAGEVQVDSADTECVEDDGTRCKECKKCNDKNCHRCSSDAAGQCKQCKKGFTRTQQGACVQCSKGCLKCKDASTCLMCDKRYYLLENAKNSNSSAKVMCVERCPVFYSPVGFKNLPKADKDRFMADDGNADANDEVKNNQKKRKEYFEAKEAFEKGTMSRADLEAKKTAIGRILKQKSTSGKKMPNGQAIDKEDEGLKDLSDGQPLDEEVTKFVEFRGVCKPCKSSCGGGCAEGWFYRDRKCVETCDKTGEVAKTLDSFSVCVCPEGMFRDKKTQNCLACQQGCSKCQSATQCDTCGSSQFLSINPVNKKRECVASCPEGFTSVPWAKMSKSLTEMYTKDRKAEAKKAEAKKMRMLATNKTNSTNSSKDLDAFGNKKPTEKELAAEKKLKERNPMEEVEVFKATTFAGMCQPCQKNCKSCAPGMKLKEDGSCAKGCNPLTEVEVQDPTTKKVSCKADNSPKLTIVWGSKSDEKDLMDDEKVQERKAARKAAVSSGDADADALDAAALGTDVDAEAEALNTGLQDPMKDLQLSARFTQQMTGEFQYSWSVRQGVDDVSAFLQGVRTNQQQLLIPATNLAGVDLKDITIACKAVQGDQRFEAEFLFKMHKKPEIGFQMPGQVESGVQFTININFDGAKLDRAEVYVLRVPAAGYQDPETGTIITAKDAQKQIEEVEKKDSNKLYAKKSEEEEKKAEKKAAGGEDNELKRFRLSANTFKNGLKWWKKAFAIKPSKEDFNVLLKLKACGATGCFVRRKFLKVVKLSDENLKKESKAKIAKMKDTSQIKNMDADELMDSLALLKEQGKGQKRSCKRGACEVKDKSGKVVDAAEVKAKNAFREKQAKEMKAAFEKKQQEAKAAGKTVQTLSCPKGPDDTGAQVECSGAGFCTAGKKSGKGMCLCDAGFEGRNCGMTESDREELKTARKAAVLKMKEDAKSGKIQNHKGQKDFLKSVLADNDDEVDIDPEVADALVESQKSYAAELKNKFKRRKQGKTDSSDADFEIPSKEELNDMMEQTLKLRKQRKLAKLAAEDKKSMDCGTNCTNATNATAASGAATKLTAEERTAKKAEREAARAAKKEEMSMMRDLQAVQGQALADEMKASGKKTQVNEQSYGDSYMKTAVLTTASIDEQMSTDASGEKKMQIGKGAQAAVATDDAVAPAPAASTDANANANANANTAPASRLLQDATATNAAAQNGSAPGNNTSGNNTAWKNLKKEEDYMRVIVNKKMFEKGGPLANISNPIIMFNKHGPDYVAEFPRGRKSDYHANGSKIELTAEQKAAKEKAKKAAQDAAKANNQTYVDPEEEADDYKLDDTVAQQVLELEFINGADMEKIPIKNLKEGMLQICMMMKNEKQKLQYVNEENDQFQEDGITEKSKTQKSTQDETNQQERKGYEMCVDLTHATTFATIDAEDSSSLFSYSMMVLMTLLAVLFFKQE